MQLDQEQLSFISNAFDKINSDCFNCCMDSYEPTVFDGKIPKISLPKYFERIQHYIKNSYEEVLFVLALLNKIEDLVFLNKHNLHRIFLTCFRLISKFYRDETFNNEDFAAIGGISIHELNSYEIELLKLLDFNLYFDQRQIDELYDKNQRQIETEAIAQ